MNARSMNVPPAVAAARTQARVWWMARAPRERWLLGAGIAVVVVFIFWSIFVAPAWRTLRTAPLELDRLDMQLQHMQSLAAEARGLRGAPPVSAAQAAEALKIATGRLGDKAHINFLGDRATLSLNGVSAQELRDWLEEARGAAHIRVVDVQLTRSPQGQTGLVVVTIGAGT
jgi:general secretion pathway protein M